MVRCATCGKVHDCYRVEFGITWADPEDGHTYKPESWEAVAFRYGYTPARERESYPPV